MLLKFLINKALVDNRTTTTLYHDNLISLVVHMGVVNSNIELFNQFVWDNRQALKIEAMTKMKMTCYSASCRLPQQVQRLHNTAANKYQWWDKLLGCWAAHVQSIWFLQALQQKEHEVCLLLNKNRSFLYSCRLSNWKVAFSCLTSSESNLKTLWKIANKYMHRTKIRS